MDNAFLIKFNEWAFGGSVITELQKDVPYSTVQVFLRLYR